jgi:5'-nucleotidase
VRILISNDDGIGSEGLLALYEELARIAEVWVVAPDREQSAASHAITLHRPLRIRERKKHWYEIDGTPTDCVYVAINHLMKQARPDVICAGINDGPNLGNDVFYSGTVAAAVEGALFDISSIAFSYAGEDRRFDVAARFAARLTHEVAARPLPKSTLLNVNVPSAASARYAVTFLGKRSYGSDVIEKTDPRGRHYYWIGGVQAGFEDLPGSDCNVVLGQSLISVTPLNLDFTDHSLLGILRTWEIPGYARELEGT